MNNKHKSLFKALSFLCILSLILSLVPPVGIWKSAIADTSIYNGGYMSYNGHDYDWWRKQADPSGKLPQSIKDPNNSSKDLYFNCEIYAERRMVVYGEPWDVPDNKLVWNFKEDPNGYFHKNKDGTGPRGWFRYAGYTMNGDLFPDKEFPNDGDGTQPVEYANVLTWSEISQLDNFTKSKLAVADYDPSKVASYQWDTVWKSRYNLKDLKSGQSLGELFPQFSNYTSPPDAFKQRAVFKGVDSQGSASVVIVHRKNGGLWYRTYSGMVIKQDPSKLSSDSVSITLDSYSYLVKLDQSGSVLKYDPATNMSPSVNVFITGILQDNLGLYGADPYYEGLVTTRNDITSYKTIINYFKITHKDPKTNEDVTIDLKKVSPNALIGEYVDAVPVSTDGNTVTFKTVSPGISISIPPNILFPGDNTVTISGKVRIELKDGRHIDASNSASTSFTIKVVPKLQKPNLELSVTPSESTVTISNGQYNPSTIQHRVKPVKVTGLTVPAGWRVVRLDFVIDKDRSRVQSATTPDYSESYDTTATSITSFTQSKTFDYNTTYIQPGKTGTPAYYGKVRYVLKDPNGNLHTSDWSKDVPVQATVRVIPKSGTPTLAAASNDKIHLDSRGNPKTFTVKINASAKIDEIGEKKIQKWEFTAVHQQNSNEKATQTVTTTSQTANTTLQVTIATNPNRTSEDFVVSATLYFTDGTKKQTNTVSVSIPVETDGSGIELTLTADKTLLSGKPGDVKSVTITAESKITATGTITDHRVWVRADYEQLSSPTKSGTQSKLIASRTFTYVLKKDMNGKDLVFVARSRATVGSQSLDSGQKTVKVRVVITDQPVPEEQPVPEDQPILPVEEPPNNPPTVLLQAIPPVVAQGDDVILVATASDQDEGDEATVTSITASGGNVEGFTQNKNQATAVFWSDETGTYTAEAIAQDTKGATGTANTTITVIPAIPRPVLYISGTLKENRKVVLDATFSYAGSKRAYILWNEAQWKITPVDSNISANSIKVVESLTGSQKLNCLFKTAGKYRVDLTLKNNYGNSASGTWYLDIKPDEKPVVSFTTPTKILRDPLDNSQASIQITSNSYSPDNDIIVKHVWFYAWDSNNDGNFDNETWYVRKSDGTWQAVGDYNKVLGFNIENFDSGNNSTITFKVTNVGKYKIELWVREEFGQETIEQFVTPYDRRRNVSTSIDDDKKIVEVLNVAPYATLNSSKVEKKKIFVNVITDYSDVNPLKSALNQLKADLYPYGVELNYIIDNSKEVVGSHTQTTTTYVPVTQTVTTSLTGSTPNFPDSIVYNGVTCYKYGSPSQTIIDYKNDYLGIGYQYYKYWIDSTGTRYSVDYSESYPPGTNKWVLTEESSFREGIYYVIMRWYDCYHEETVYGYTQTYVGYTTVLVPQTTTVTVNIEGLSANTIKELTENVNDKYLVFVSNGTGNNFSNGFGNYFSFSALSKEHLRYVILNNYAVYATVPSSAWDYKLPESTKQQYTIRQFVNYAPAGGKLYDVNQFTTILNNDIKPKYTNPQLTPDPVYVLADEEKVIYYPYFEDYENDTIINQRWRYEHDETVFDNSQGKAEFDSTWLNAPIEVFTKPGKYTVTFQVQDSPPPGTDDFDDYKLWSKLERQMILYVHRRPIADFTAVYNKFTVKLTITDKSYDPDHQYNRADKGIINWHWQYKTIDDSTWTDTTLSNLQSMTLQSGKIYLIKLEVQDCDGPNGVGVWSKPKIAMIDLSVANNPPVADFTIDSEILKGNQPSNLTDKSYDPDNDPITAWHWWIYNSDGSINKDFCEVGNNNIATIKSYIATLTEGSYKLSLQVKDSAGNYSTITTKQFRVYSQSKDTTQELVNNPPTGTFTMTITDHRTRLRPQTTYSDPDGDPRNAEQWYIKFNGQTQYFDKLPNTLEEAGYTYDGTYEIGYRVQDNPTGRSPSLKPLWSNWYVQTYYISTDITIQAWTEKIAQRVRNYAEAVATGLATVKSSDFKIGEVVVVKAKTTGYVEKIDVWLDRVTTTTPKQGKVTKEILGYWTSSIKDGTMTFTDTRTNMLPAQEVANRDLSYEALTGKKPLKFTPMSVVPYSMDWSSDPCDYKLQLQFIRSNRNSYVMKKFPDRYMDLWDGVYKWNDWPLGNTFSYSKAMELYGRPPYLQKGDTVYVKLRAYKRNIDGSYTTKDVDIPINITGSIELATGEIR